MAGEPFARRGSAVANPRHVAAAVAIARNNGFSISNLLNSILMVTYESGREAVLYYHSADLASRSFVSGIGKRLSVLEEICRRAFRFDFPSCLPIFVCVILLCCTTRAGRRPAARVIAGCIVILGFGTSRPLAPLPSSGA